MHGEKAEEHCRGLGRLDPAAHRRRDDGDLSVVVIETPKGSRSKYAYDPVERVFGFKTVLPAGMALPYGFDFIPSTLGGDGVGCSGVDG